jgi:hypothetical protein
MDRYIIDLKTGWKYELAGDYYLPIGTRFEIADQATSEDGRHMEKPAASSAESTRTTQTTPAVGPSAKTNDRPVIGRFGRAHTVFLKRTQRHVYSQLVAEGKLATYLAQIDEQANSMLDLLIRQMAEREGVTEDLKANDQMAWVRHMNNIRNRAEEIVSSECIYR